MARAWLPRHGATPLTNCCDRAADHSESAFVAAQATVRERGLPAGIEPPGIAPVGQRIIAVPNDEFDYVGDATERNLRVRGPASRGRSSQPAHHQGASCLGRGRKCPCRLGPGRERRPGLSGPIGVVPVDLGGEGPTRHVRLVSTRRRTKARYKPPQLYRLLDPTNYSKSARQLLAVLALGGASVTVADARRTRRTPHSKIPA